MGTKWNRQKIKVCIELEAEVVGKPKGQELWPGSAKKGGGFLPGFGRNHSSDQILKAVRKVIEENPVEWLLERVCIAEYVAMEDDQ